MDRLTLHSQTRENPGRTSLPIGGAPPSKRTFYRHGAGIALCLGLLIGASPGCGPDDLPLGEGGGGAGGGGEGGSPPAPLSVTPAPGGARRIIARQYVASIRTLLGDEAAAAAKPPQDPQLLGLETIAATDLATPTAFLEAYANSAEDVAAVAISSPTIKAKIVPCTPTGPADTACYKQFANAFGSLAWRRPLTDTEATRLANVGVVAGNAYVSADMGLRFELSAMLQSPNFLYIVEIGEPDEENPDVRRLTPRELVTRMSFFLHNSTPPKALLDAADSGALAEEAGIRAMAEQLIAQPEAVLAIDAFYDEVYQLRALATLPKDEVLFPEFTASMRQSMREETLRLMRDIVWERDSDALEILNANYTFVNGELATLYGVPGVTGPDFVKVTLPASQERAGFISQGSFLSRNAHAEDTSPTRRGAFITDTLLCVDVAPPPPGVNPTLPPDDGMHKTKKQALQAHEKDPNCASCHTVLDPPGFALEHFDAIGKYRETDEGLTLDVTGEVEGLGAFDGPKELADVLANDARSASCIVKKFYRHSIGHFEKKGEIDAIKALDADFADGGHSIQTLLVNLCASPAFRLVSDPK